MKKTMWILVGVALAGGVYAQDTKQDASLKSRIEAARLMYEAALDKNQKNKKCVEKAQGIIATMQEKKQNLELSALDSYKDGFMAAYGSEGKNNCTPLSDIKTKPFANKFRQEFEGFPFPEDLKARVLISRKGEFLDNIFSKERITRLGTVGMNTKILSQEQIDKVISYLQKATTKAER